MELQVIPEDMMAALGGGGGMAAGPAAGGLPPDIMAALGGGADEAGLPSIADGEPGGGLDPLTQAIDLLQEAIDAEADQEDVQVMLQCQAKLQQILAKNQAESDSMMQGKMNPRGLRKAMAGAGDAGGGY